MTETLGKVAVYFTTSSAPYTDVLKVDPLPADAEETWAKWETILSALDKGTTENIMKIPSTSDKSVVSDFKSVNCTVVVCGGK